MSWAIGFDSHWERDIGYGVPAWCETPRCPEKIDRGLAHVCGGEPYGGDHGCGLYFCSAHLVAPERNDVRQLCVRCDGGDPPYDARPDHPEWIRFKLTDHSWEPWRTGHGAQVEAMRAQLVKVDG